MTTRGHTGRPATAGRLLLSAMAALVVAYGLCIVVSQGRAILAHVADWRTVFRWWTEPRYLLFLALFGACACTLVKPRVALNVLRCSAAWALMSLSVLLPRLVRGVADTGHLSGTQWVCDILRPLWLPYAIVLVVLLVAAQIVISGVEVKDAQQTSGVPREAVTRSFGLAILGTIAIAVGLASGVLGYDGVRRSSFVVAGVSMTLAHLGLPRHFLVGAAIAAPGISVNGDCCDGSILGAALVWGPAVVLGGLALLDRRCLLRVRVVGILVSVSLLVVCSIAPVRVICPVRLVTIPQGDMYLLERLNRSAERVE